MTTQNYLMVNPSNVVDNICVWDGDVNTWTPPQGYTMLVLDTTPAMVWGLLSGATDYTLVEEIGVTDIGFTWDGSVCTTNQPQPQPPKPATDQAVVTGLQTIGA